MTDTNEDIDHQLGLVRLGEGANRRILLDTYLKEDQDLYDRRLAAAARVVELQAKRDELDKEIADGLANVSSLGARLKTVMRARLELESPSIQKAAAE